MQRNIGDPRQRRAAIRDVGAEAQSLQRRQRHARNERLKLRQIGQRPAHLARKARGLQRRRGLPFHRELRSVRADRQLHRPRRLRRRIAQPRRRTGLAICLEPSPGIICDELERHRRRLARLQQFKRIQCDGDALARDAVAPSHRAILDRYRIDLDVHRLPRRRGWCRRGVRRGRLGEHPVATTVLRRLDQNVRLDHHQPRNLDAIREQRQQRHLRLDALRCQHLRS